MFVVKRPFRDAKGMIPAGSTVEPAGLKRFKHRLQEGHIVEVNEHNFDRYSKFFKDKYGVVLPSLTRHESKSDTGVKANEAEPKPKPKATAPAVKISVSKK